jgi:hypothetical protein
MCEHSDTKLNSRFMWVCCCDVKYEEFWNEVKKFMYTQILLAWVDLFLDRRIIFFKVTLYPATSDFFLMGFT